MTRPKCEYCGTTEWDTYSPAYDFGGGGRDGREVIKHWCCRAGREIFERVGEDPGARFDDGDTLNYLNRPAR